MINSRMDNSNLHGKGDFFQVSMLAVALWTVLTLGLHLWPFEGSRSLEILAPVNLGIMLWVPLAGTAAILSRQKRQLIRKNLPDASIWALLAIAAMSLIFSPHVSQSATSLIKLVLMYVGGFTLFHMTCSREGWANRICTTALVSVCISMAVSVGWRSLGREGLGFFGNPYKYGTVTAILFTMGIIHLTTKTNVYSWFSVPLAALAAVAGVSLAGVCGIITGFLVGILVIRNSAARFRLSVCLLMLIAIPALFWRTPFFSPLRDDVRISESNGVDLRQRYIEWQAELNLFQEKPVTGTGLGCVNEYRSMFYGRLPKLNTLQPFDRNGWLLIAAETGIFGLVAFIWMIARALRKTWQASRSSGPQRHLAAAAFASLVAACVANTFSFVNYNGVVTAFILVLALAYCADWMCRSDKSVAPEDAKTDVDVPCRSASSSVETRECNG